MNRHPATAPGHPPHRARARTWPPAPQPPQQSTTATPYPYPPAHEIQGACMGPGGGGAGASGSRHVDVRASRECREQTRRRRVSAWVRAGGERGEHGDVRVRPVGVHRRIHRWSRVKVGHRGYTPPVLFHVMLLNEPAGGNVCPIVIPLLTTRTLCTCDTPWQTAP